MLRANNDQKSSPAEIGSMTSSHKKTASTGIEFPREAFENSL
jgi:hypothetical protein